MSTAARWDPAGSSLGGHTATKHAGSAAKAKSPAALKATTAGATDAAGASDAVTASSTTSPVGWTHTTPPPLAMPVAVPLLLPARTAHAARRDDEDDDGGVRSSGRAQAA